MDVNLRFSVVGNTVFVNEDILDFDSRKTGALDFSKSQTILVFIHDFC